MKRYMYLWVSMFVLMTSCNDNFLERSPLVNINDSDYWSSANDLKLYVNGFYNNDGLFPSLRACGVLVPMFLMLLEEAKRMFPPIITEE